MGRWVDFRIARFKIWTFFMSFLFKQNMVRNPKKISTGHEHNQVVKKVWRLSSKGQREKHNYMVLIMMSCEIKTYNGKQQDRKT